MRHFLRWKLCLIFCFSLVAVSYIFPAYLQPVRAQRIPTPQVLALETSLENSDVYSFVKEGFNYAVELYGEPRIAVNQVNLNFYSTPMTSLENAQQGEFTIYLNRGPSEYAFYGQLSHEIAHLLNAQLFDCYVEGMNMVFAEKMLKSKGLDWSGWESYFRQGNEPLYGSSYFMMNEVAETAGKANIEKFLSFAVYNDETKKRMYVDIDRWLSSMSDNAQTEVKKVINKHISAVREAVNSAYPSFSCPQPS
ncbi:MAG: hypothetical protein SXA11_06265 [Cyanobacteriota bacterium]|nr:hypothetical protein [Cyanobacteriota bacterium]